MNCKQCNSEIGNNRFCPNCGTENVVMPQMSTPPQYQAPQYEVPQPQYEQVNHAPQYDMPQVPQYEAVNHAPQYDIPQAPQYEAVNQAPVYNMQPEVPTYAPTEQSFSNPAEPVMPVAPMEVSTEVPQYNEPVANNGGYIDDMQYGNEHANVSVEPAPVVTEQPQFNPNAPYQNLLPNNAVSNPYANPQGQDSYQQFMPQNNQNAQYGAPTPPPVQNQAAVDPGKNKALACLIWGILSTVCMAIPFDWIMSIVSLVMAKKYKLLGNGANEGQVKAGKIFGIIGLVGSILISLVYLALLLFMIIGLFSLGSM